MYKRAFQAVEEMGFEPKKLNDQAFSFSLDGVTYGVGTKLDDSEYLNVYRIFQFDNDDCNKSAMLWKMAKIGHSHPYVKCWIGSGRFNLYSIREVLAEDNIKECILRSVLHIEAAVEDVEDAMEELLRGYDD